MIGKTGAKNFASVWKKLEGFPEGRGLTGEGVRTGYESLRGAT
jgi:hypothetical protein